MRSVLSELRVPGGQVLVGQLPGAVKHEDTSVSLVIVGPMHRVEPLLARGIPKV